MRTGVTLADITQAADELLAAGERPTVEGIRKALGTGSPNTVNTLLKQYYQTLPARLNLPAPIATAAAELYEKVRVTAMDDLASERAALQQGVADERERLAQEKRDFDAERSAGQQRMADLTGDLDRTREQLKVTAGKLAATEKELATQSTRAATAEAQFRAAEDERDRASQKHASDLQRQREQAEGNERHLLGRLDEQKGQLQRLTQDREREAAAAEKRAATLETSLSESSKLNASLRADLTSTQRELAKGRELEAVANAALTRAQEQFARDSSVRQAELNRARADIEQLTAAADQHRRDRDEAIREAAKLEGRLTAVQSQFDEAKTEIRRLQKAK